MGINRSENDPCTTDLAEFGRREKFEVTELLMCWLNKGLPEDFEEDGYVRPMFNRNSGHVFLTNGEYQVCMMNGDKLESWYSCPNCGHEGFGEDCKVGDDGVCNECCELEEDCSECDDEEGCHECKGPRD